jgi:hypothetical protein
MDIERPNHPPLSNEELQQLEKLEKLLKKSVADGVITRAELDAIKVQIAADGKVMVEELDLVRQFIQDKVSRNELVVESF